MKYVVYVEETCRYQFTVDVPDELLEDEHRRYVEDYWCEFSSDERDQMFTDIENRDLQMEVTT